MKLEAPVNKNYAATVVKIKTTTKLENCDNVVGTPIFGFQAIVGKDVKEGDIGIVFPAETRLSESFCEMNNLYRHSDKNYDQSKRGYIEDNRRVKAVKFRGHRSDCLFMPLESLMFTGVDLSELQEGDEFDQLDGIKICEKYEVERPSNKKDKMVEKVFKRVDKKFLPEHYDNENYFKNEQTISNDTAVIVTQKLHGTSIRIGNTIVAQKPTILERIGRLLGARIEKTTFDYVYGSRRVIKDINNPNQIHFYGDDIWTHEGKKLVGLIPKNYIVYAELIGWTQDGAEIQRNYTYEVPQGQAELYVYRVANVNEDGYLVDMHWDHVKEFCQQRAIKHVPELWRGKKKDFDAFSYMDKRFSEQKRKKYTDKPVSLGKNKDLVDEGVCIRVEGIVPMIYKAKSPIFLQHESRMLDENVADLESTQTEGEI